MTDRMSPADTYRLLDSGNEEKLEAVGPYRLVRPAPQAVWKPHMPAAEWKKADATYRRGNASSGDWHWQRQIPRTFQILFSRISFQIKLTDFGHLGIFPEQADNWHWMRDLIQKRMAATRHKNLTVLNLFAYTGGSTLAASQAGAHVVHVDAAKGVVDWARENARDSHLLDRPIRWLVDDTLKFVKREVRRKSRFQAIILDPPSFGRGPKGEVFKLENDLLSLLDACRQLLADDALFLLLTCHTPGFTPITLHNTLADAISPRGGLLEQGEMTVAEQDGRLLPSGSWVRWRGEGGC